MRAELNTLRRDKESKAMEYKAGAATLAQTSGELMSVQTFRRMQTIDAFNWGANQTPSLSSVSICQDKEKIPNRGDSGDPCLRRSAGPGGETVNKPTSQLCWPATTRERSSLDGANPSQPTSNSYSRKPSSSCLAEVATSRPETCMSSPSGSREPAAAWPTSELFPSTSMSASSASSQENRASPPQKTKTPQSVGSELASLSGLGSKVCVERPFRPTTRSPYSSKVSTQLDAAAAQLRRDLRGIACNSRRTALHK